MKQLTIIATINGTAAEVEFVGRGRDKYDRYIAVVDGEYIGIVNEEAMTKDRAKLVRQILRDMEEK